MTLTLTVSDAAVLELRRYLMGGSPRMDVLRDAGMLTLDGERLNDFGRACVVAILVGDGYLAPHQVQLTAVGVR